MNIRQHNILFILFLLILTIPVGCTQQPVIQDAEEKQVVEEKPDYTDIDLLLKSDDDDLRSKGVDKLNGIKHDSVKYKYEPLLGDSHPGIRVKVAWGVARFKEYFEAEMDRLMFSSDPYKKEVAYLFNLQIVAEDAQQNFARDFINNPDFTPEAKDFAIRILVNGLLKQPEKISDLIALENDQVFKMVEKFIRKFDKEKILPLLKKEAINDNPDIQLKAMKLLTKIGGYQEINDLFPLAFSNNYKDRSQFLKFIEQNGYHDKSLIALLRYFMTDPKSSIRQKSSKLLDDLVKKPKPTDAIALEIPAKYKLLLENPEQE